MVCKVCKAMHLVNTWCLRSKMIQIWFGIIWVNAKDQNTQKKQIKHQDTQNTCLFCTLFCDMGSGNKESAWMMNQSVYSKSRKTLSVQFLDSSQDSRFWGKTFWIPIQDSRFKILRKTFWIPIQDSRFKILGETIL